MLLNVQDNPTCRSVKKIQTDKKNSGNKSFPKKTTAKENKCIVSVTKDCNKSQFCGAAH